MLRYLFSLLGLLDENMWSRYTVPYTRFVVSSGVKINHALIFFTAVVVAILWGVSINGHCR